MRAVGFLSGRSLATDKHLVVAFGRGLSEAGYVEGRDVTIDYNWAEGQIDRLPALATGLVRRQVSVIFAGGMDVKSTSRQRRHLDDSGCLRHGGRSGRTRPRRQHEPAWRQRHGSNCGYRCALVENGSNCYTAGYRR